MSSFEKNSRQHESPFHEGILCTLQRMLGKLEKFLHQQKSSRSPAPPLLQSVEMAVEPQQQQPQQFCWANHSCDDDFLNEDEALALDAPALSWNHYELDANCTCRELAERIESTLKEAKSGSLRCSEMLIPTDLTYQIARDTIRLAEDEPCGLRGLVLLLDYEDQSESRRIGRLQYDSTTVPTFELFLTLKKDQNSWLNVRYLLPFRGCFRKTGKGPTIVVSPAYTMVKRKLFRSQTS